MAKRKAAQTRRRKAAGTRAGASRRGTKKAAGSARSAARSRAAKSTRAGAKKTSRKKTGVRKTAASRPPSRKATRPPSPKATRAAAASRTRKRSATSAKKKRPASPAPRAAAPKPRAVPVRPAAARKPAGLDRERRRVMDEDDDIVMNTPPSSLDMDRTASAARTGRRRLKDTYDEHTATSPTVTGGDVDADWESAYNVGDEAPGGDNPTPDQDIVDDIGRAVGLEYQDNEELKAEEKLVERDRHRWELDPASSEDYDER